MIELNSCRLNFYTLEGKKGVNIRRHNNNNHGKILGKKSTFSSEITVCSTTIQLARNPTEMEKNKQTDTNKQTGTTSAEPDPRLLFATDAFVSEWRREPPPERRNRNLWIERVPRSIPRQKLRGRRRRGETGRGSGPTHRQRTQQDQEVSRNNITSGVEPKSHTWKHEVRFSEHNHVSNWFNRHIFYASVRRK